MSERSTAEGQDTLAEHDQFQRLDQNLRATGG